MTPTDPRYSVIPARAASDARLKLGDLRTLNALGVYADKHGECHPSYADIEGRFGIPRSTLRYCIRRLQGFGYVEVAARIKLDGAGQGSNKYRLIHDNEDPARRPEVGLDSRPLKMDTPVSTQISTGVLTGANTPPANLGQQDPCQSHQQGKNDPIERRSSEANASSDLPSLFANAQSEGAARRGSSNGKDRIGAADVKAAADAYNLVAQRTGWRRCKADALSKPRKDKIATHLRARGGLAGWMRDLAAMEALRWTHGDAKRSAEHENWQFSLDCMFVAKFRNRMDDHAADGASNGADRLANQRVLCDARRRLGRWPGGMSPDEIDPAIRPEYPDLFRNEAAA